MSCGHDDMTWTPQAACRGEDTELFFPSSPGDTYHEALAICARCPVRQECLDYAVNHMGKSEQWGVWGGKTRNERIAMKREQSIPTTRNCRHCNKEFVANNPRKRYCDKECRYLYSERMRKRETMTPGKVPYVNKEFQVQ